MIENDLPYPGFPLFFDHEDLFADDMEDCEESSNLKLPSEEVKLHPAWSDYICKKYGTCAAIAFAVGSDKLLESTYMALVEFEDMPEDANITALKGAMASQLIAYLPKQFVMNYDRAFIADLNKAVVYLRELACNGQEIIAHNVIQELALYIIALMAEKEADCAVDQLLLGEYDPEECDLSHEWVFDVFGDMDIVTFLYSNMLLMPMHAYYFDYWKLPQFYIDDFPEDSDDSYKD